MVLAGGVDVILHGCLQFQHPARGNMTVVVPALQVLGRGCHHVRDAMLDAHFTTMHVMIAQHHYVPSIIMCRGYDGLSHAAEGWMLEFFVVVAEPEANKDIVRISQASEPEVDEALSERQQMYCALDALPIRGHNLTTHNTAKT